MDRASGEVFMLPTIAVYTLTRDRLPYTKVCFDSLIRNAGCKFHHFVFDNGSSDQTQLWLQQEYKPFKLMAVQQNLGISKASNACLDAIFKELPDVDVIAKIDNDCNIESPDLLAEMASLVKPEGGFAPKYVLSPHVKGITRQPERGRMINLVGNANTKEPMYEVGLTAIVGGLCHFVPAEVYRQYRYPISGDAVEGKPITYAWGQDDHFCEWFKKRGGNVGYVESLFVEHFETTDGQCKRFPEYFKRKWEEEKQPYDRPQA